MCVCVCFFFNVPAKLQRPRKENKGLLFPPSCFVLFFFVDEEVELQLRLGLCCLCRPCSGGSCISTSVEVWPRLASSGWRTSVSLTPLEQGRWKYGRGKGGYTCSPDKVYRSGAALRDDILISCPKSTIEAKKKKI